MVGKIETLEASWIGCEGKLRVKRNNDDSEIKTGADSFDKGRSGLTGAIPQSVPISCNTTVSRHNLADFDG